MDKNEPNHSRWLFLHASAQSWWLVRYQNVLYHRQCVRNKHENYDTPKYNWWTLNIEWMTGSAKIYDQDMHRCMIATSVYFTVYFDVIRGLSWFWVMWKLILLRHCHVTFDVFVLFGKFTRCYAIIFVTKNDMLLRKTKVMLQKPECIVIDSFGLLEERETFKKSCSYKCAYIIITLHIYLYF